MLKLSNKTNNKIVFFDSQLEAKKWAMNNIKWISERFSEASAEAAQEQLSMNDEDWKKLSAYDQSELF